MEGGWKTLATSPTLVYSTPEWVTRGLLENEIFEDPIWEPACGYGGISKVLEANNLYIVSSDINGMYGTTLDFLKVEKSNQDCTADIITNPPFSLAEEFLEKALQISRRKVAFLLRLAFLESQTRKELFERTPLKKVLVSSRRITMYPENYTGETKNGGTMAMAWFIWDKQYNGQPYLEWF